MKELKFEAGTFTVTFNNEFRFSITFQFYFSLGKRLRVRSSQVRLGTHTFTKLTIKTYELNICFFYNKS